MGEVPCYRVDGSCLFQVPEKRGPAPDIEFIAVLDCSGSMRSYWSKVARAINAFRAKAPRLHTIVFHSMARQIQGHVSEDLEEIGSGGTAIDEGINLMKNLVSKLRSSGSKRFLIIFVSDGYDGVLRSSQHDFAGENFEVTGMEFTTVGVGEYFPAHVSMGLRRSFHHGRVNIPNVTLVEEPDEYYDAFTKMTDELLGCSGETIDLCCNVQVAPWEKPISSVYEQSWVIMEENTTLSIKSKEDDFSIEMKDSDWTFAAGESILKQWMNMLHSAALSGVDVRPWASHAVELGEKIAERVELAEKKELETVSTKHPSVWQRLQKHLKTTQHVLFKLLKELRLLANGDILSNLSDADLAQRLAIGTQEGKHHKRAMKWKGITAEDFGTYVTKFEKIMDSCLPVLQSGPADEDRSAVSLESNGDILLQPDLLKAIKALPSQYYLVECVPVVGHPLKIIRTNASMINPWMITVESISRICPFLDTCTLQEMEDSDGFAEFSLGGGEAELLNAVCPLFTADVAQNIGPFFRSYLYGMLMTHIVCKNIDTLDKDSHPALLASMLCHLLGLPASTWRDELVGRIIETMKGVYLGRFPAMLGALKDDPKLAMVTDHPSLKSKCQSLSKPMLLAMCLGDSLSIEQKTVIVQRLYLEHIGRILGNNPDILDWFIVSDAPVTDGIESKLAKLNIDVTRYISEQALKKDIEKAVTGMEFNKPETSQMKVELDSKKLKAASKSTRGPVSLCNLSSFSSWILGKDVPEIPLSCYVFHGCIHKNSYDRAMNIVPTEEHVQNKVLAQFAKQAQKKFARKMCEEMQRKAGIVYNNHFARTHKKSVLPMKWNEIVDIHRSKGMAIPEPAELGYDEDCGLCSGCCMAPSCSLFLVPTKQLNLHLEADRKSGRMIEAFHRCIRILRHESMEVIEQALMSGEHMLREPKATYFSLFASDMSPDLRADIKLVKEKYLEIFG